MTQYLQGLLLLSYLRGRGQGGLCPFAGSRLKCLDNLPRPRSGTTGWQKPSPLSHGCCHPTTTTTTDTHTKSQGFALVETQTGPLTGRHIRLCGWQEATPL